MLTKQTSIFSTMSVGTIVISMHNIFIEISLKTVDIN